MPNDIEEKTMTRSEELKLIGTICKILKHIFQTTVVPFHER